MFECPSRGGTRGGKALFDWESVKSDKYRESYLGHSLNAPVGRWQQNKDLNWYAKGEGGRDGDISEDKISKEIKEAKEKELEALTSMLCNKHRGREKGSAVSKEEIKSLLRADQFNDLELEAQGLGYSRTSWGLQSSLAVKDILDGTEDIGIDSKNQGADDSKRNVDENDNRMTRSFVNEKRLARTTRRNNVEKGNHKEKSGSRHHYKSGHHSSSRCRSGHKHHSDSKHYLKSRNHSPSRKSSAVSNSHNYTRKRSTSPLMPSHYKRKRH